ncbi:MAG: hypothetical protein ACP5HL_02800, partial [Minisyncoccia bacterium]
YPTDQIYSALEVKITGRFIPFPKPKPPIPEIKQCQTDSDCTWCGMSCVNKEEIKGKACPQVMPKPGSACRCVNNRCEVGPLIAPTTTLTKPVTTITPITTLTGKVTAINIDSTNPNTGSFSLVKNINWFQKLREIILMKSQNNPIALQVTTNTKFYLRTSENNLEINNNSENNGFVEGSFSDLKVNDHVVVKAYPTDQIYSALEVKITGRFIPFPKPKP